MTQEQKLSVLLLAYSAWTARFDELKAAKQERPDGSPDWAEFHRARLAAAQTKEAEAHATLEALRAEWSDISLG